MMMMKMKMKKKKKKEEENATRRSSMPPYPNDNSCAPRRTSKPQYDNQCHAPAAELASLAPAEHPGGSDVHLAVPKGS